jgi:hypothetical protein
VFGFRQLPGLDRGLAALHGWGHVRIEEMAARWTGPGVDGK